MVVLHELNCNPVPGEGFGAVALREESAMIAEARRGDYDDAGERGWFYKNGQKI